MSNVTVNISFQDGLLREIDRVSRAESRSRSEFLREAARAYIQRKQRWTDLFTLGDKVARKNRLTPDTVSAEIAEHRKARAAGR